MTIQQALRKARKLWGPTAGVQVHPKGAFIGDDLKWHDSMMLVCQHGQRYERCKIDRKCPVDFYIKSREPELVLGRMKYLVPEYQVGRVMMGMFFEVRGSAESFERAFEEAARRRS